jgi:signal transduction histidine kinase
MDIWIVLFKLIIIAYCVITYIETTADKMTAVVLFLLIYICINIAMYILKPPAVKKALILLSLIGAGAAVQTFGAVFILLIPINICEFFQYYSNSYSTTSIVVLSVTLLVQEGYRRQYTLIAFMTLLFFKLAIDTYTRISMLIQNNDSLTEKNHELSVNVHRGLDNIKQVKYTSQLEERNKIAQEIHDKVGHTISGSLMQLEAAKILLHKDMDKAEKMICNTIEVLRGGMENIRVTLRSIKPAAEQMGINRLKLLCDEFQTSNNITVILSYKGDLDKVSYEQWKVIYDNTVEAMTNALKYSKSSRISITLEVFNKLIKSEVKDNGVGCIKFNKGIGIRGIEERSSSIGGKVIIDGSRGFSIIVLMPIGS